MARIRSTIAGVVLFLFISALALGVAQSQILTGSITGQVVDSTGAAIPGALARAVDLATSHEYRAVTNENGEFAIEQVPFGFYHVTVQAKGFTMGVVERVQVDVSQVSHLNLKLGVAAMGETVEVKAEQAVVQTESAEIKNSVDRIMIVDLPLPTRNPLDLINGMAGIVKPGNTSDSFVHGMRGNATNITQDGINVADNTVKSSSFFAISAPTVDTVGEFNVSVAGQGTDSGFGAAQVNIVTQRGQDALHGSVFWFQRTSYLNANTYFNNATGIPKPFQLQNRIGYNVGGPIYVPKIYNGKHKTWFFNAFEAFREPVSRSRPRLVLSDAARLANFTYTRQDTKLPQTINLLSIGTIGTTGQAPAINSAYMGYYNGLVPSPNGDAGCSGGDGNNLRCFTWNVAGRNLTNRYTGRLDHQLTKSHSIEFVYNQANFTTTNDFLNGIEQYFPNSPGGGQASKRQVFTWAFHSAFGANKANTARFGLQRAPVTFTIADNFAGTNGLQVAVPNSFSITAGGTLLEPSIVSTNLPQGRNTPVRQLLDNFSWIKGRHALEFTGEWRWILSNNFFFNTIPQLIQLGNNSANPDGIVASKFPGGIGTGDLTNASRVFDLVTGLLGTTSEGFNHTSPTSGYIAGIPRLTKPSQQNYAASVQDNWKFRPNLTLQFGVRWEFQGPFDLRNKLILQPDDRIGGVFGPAGPGNYFNVLTTPAVTDVLFSFAGGNNGKPLYDSQYKNFAPLVGFAWDPFKNGKTAVRGGFATYFTQDGFTLFAPASTGNNGLFTVATNTVPTGVFNPAAFPTLTAPADQFPVSERTVFATNSGSNTINVFKPDLAVPYVLEWHLAVQREIPGRVTVEARYVGNHGVRLYRTYNINELNIRNNPYTDASGNSVANVLTEFNNAGSNLAICQGNAAACIAAQAAGGVAANRQSANNFGFWGLPGQTQLPILNTLFAGLSGGSTAGFASPTFVTALTPSQGLNLATMFNTLRTSPTYAANRAAFPFNFFVPMPWASTANFIDNSSYSTYHGGEFEVRRRFSSGLYFVGNYTFSKTLGDFRSLSSQTEGQVYRSIADRALDKSRAAFDVTHNVSGTVLYPLPIGKGQRLLRNANGFVNTLVGGWNLQGLTRWSTGSPFTISSGRFPNGGGLGATNVAESAVLRNMSMSQFQSELGVFKTANGVFFINPNSGLITITGAGSRPVLCTPGQTTPCFDFPGAGQFGNTPFNGWNGPNIFNQDLSVIKRTNVPRLGEHFNFEIRLEAFNALNHPSFQTPAAGNTSLLSTSFGQLTSIVDTVRGGGVTSRIVQWAIRVNF
ncbi:MAG TPA: carboxypeptidase-like regulatory domain-containing protein [Candidatus Acidoferrum sp.]|nr:carboxypeptidase-like regulatory domain-containing protein [Candidatus Acidoferrum sp.]